MARLLPPESGALEDVSGEVGISVDTQRWRSESLAQPARDLIWTAAARFDAVLTTFAGSPLRALVEGQHGFYLPRSWLGQDPLASPGPDGASWYDHRPMVATLEGMVDFDRLNDGGTRVSLGAVDVATGNLEYFDNTRMRLDASSSSYWSEGPCRA